MVAKEDEIEVLHKLCEWAKEVLTQEELNNMLFLARDGYGRTVGASGQRRAK
jgi:hypothetical protein